MIIVSENLAGIVSSLKICDPSLIEEFSLQIRLDRQIRRLRESTIELAPIQYGSPIDHAAYFHEAETVLDSVLIRSQECVLACSQNNYSMPRGYFGLIQTKGTLARLFVSATANDGQVEPGYSGRLTLELTNHSPFSIEIRPGAVVAQMFIFRCSSEVAKPYCGRYQNATGPTLPIID
jgi:dCTP deaminase